MKLKPLANSEIGRVANWLAEKENYQWLGFCGGIQVLTAVQLKLMIQRDVHRLGVFSVNPDDIPIGLVALSDIRHDFKTGTLWYVLGDKRFSGLGYTTRAVSMYLKFAFLELQLQSVYAWSVAKNIASIRVLERNGFRLIGRRRKCHVIEGYWYDRLHYDLLAEEYTEIL